MFYVTDIQAKTTSDKRKIKRRKAIEGERESKRERRERGRGWGGGGRERSNK